MTFLVDQSPKEVFEAVLNVRGWWQGFYEEEITGESRKLNDEFTFRAGDGAHITRQKLVEVVPYTRLVWLVTFSELSFLEQKEEWEGTRLVFDISPKGNKTELKFTHDGLKQEIECYDVCSTAWSKYMTEKLLPLVKTGDKAASTATAS